MPQSSFASLGIQHAHQQERIDLAAAFRWAERLGLHEAVANHFSLAVNEDGSQFLMNPNQMHFSRIKASDLQLLNANDKDTMTGPHPPDPTAWGLHGSIHRMCPHARCLMHVHSMHATVLASLTDSTLPPIDQSTAMFYGRHIVDTTYGGLAFAEEGERCAALLDDPKIRIMVMGNHGVLAIGPTVADALFQLYYFERAAETYIRALQTGQPLRLLSHAVAQKTSDEIAEYPGSATNHLKEIKLILDEEGSTYAQ